MRFYSTYWVCDRLRFETAEQLYCAVVSEKDAFGRGWNRLDANWNVLHATPHPAYVFDSQWSGGLPEAAHQVATLVATADPRFAGYSMTHIAGYDVYYHAS